MVYQTMSLNKKITNNIYRFSVFVADTAETVTIEIPNTMENEHLISQLVQIGDDVWVYEDKDKQAYDILTKAIQKFKEEK